ncbi:MAG: efflux RND transporter permease subunit [Acidobacteria bacterium]|nr:efflux RND transporter permease subunit [Acidobacteriota bacterium]
MQKLAEICVRRPVFATMLMLALTVVGAFSVRTLGVDRFPNVDFPIISVITTNPGAAPEQVETEITDVIEGAVNTISGIDELRSTSLESLSMVNITFAMTKDVDVAAQEVRDKVNLVLAQLPETAESPIVQKLDPDAAPILMYAVGAPRGSIEVNTIVENVLEERLESINGVGEVLIYGGRRREIHVSVNPDRLRAYNLTVGDVAQALRTQNLELPGGRVEEGAREVTVRTLGRLVDAGQFANVTIRTRDGYPIRIRDVGTVEDAGEEPRSAAMLDGRPAVVVAVRKQSGTNTAAVAAAVKERMAEIQPLLPGDFSVSLIRDQSEFINRSLAAIEEHLVLGGIFAALVVLVFLGNLRSTVIAAIAIPVSIVGAFALMAVLGYTLNQMTMLALTLMVGVVIDDAIVVLENIYRFVEEKGMSPFQAAIEGTREIGLAVMATTLSLLAVFVPVGFMSGIVGRFMSSFGLTAAAAIAISLLVSFTLTPMLAARWIKPHAGAGGDGGHSTKESWWYRPIDRGYTRMLTWSMAHRWAIVGLSIATVLSIAPLAMMAGINFIPEEDESQFEITMRAPEGTSLAATQSVMERIARDIREMPGVQNTLSIAGFGTQQVVNSGTTFVRLVPIGDRERSQAELIRQAREIVATYPKDLTTSVQPVAAVGGGGFRNAAVQYVLSGPDIAMLDAYSSKLMEAMRANPNLVDVDRTLLPGKPELRVEIDRQRAADLGVSVAAISETLNIMMAGQEVTTFNQGRDQFDVVLRGQGAFRRDAESLRRMTVSAAGGLTVPLASVVRLQAGTAPASIDRLNRERQVTLLANVPPGGSQSVGLAAIEAATAALGMEPGYAASVTGQSRELQRAGTAFATAVLLSFIFMYMVLAAQFESFIHPVTILLTLPLAVPFGLLTTAMFGQRLNIFSILGLLLLFGIVKKNAILQIDHTLELRQQGMPRYDAIIQANRNRLRPILMTTIALVAGMLPLIWGSGPGAATNRSIGLLVAGGQTLCLLLTLLAVPVFYSLFEDLGQWSPWRRLRAIAPGRGAAAAGSTAALLSLAVLAPAPARAQVAAPRAELTRAAVPARVGVTADITDLSLDDAVARALANNADIVIARLGTEAAGSRTFGARGAYDAIVFGGTSYERAVTPQASLFTGGENGQLTTTGWVSNAGVRGLSKWAGASYDVTFSSARLTNDNPFTTLTPQFATNVSARYTQPLLRGREIDAARAQIEIASRSEDLSGAQLRQRAMDAVAGVEQAYWSLGFAVRNLDVQRQALDQARRQVESNRRRAEQGLLAPIDIVEAETQVATLEQSVYAAQELVTRAENVLKLLIAADRADAIWNRQIRPTTPIAPDPVSLTLEDALTRAMANRPELAQLEVSEAINAIERRLYRDQARPQVDLVGTYTLAGLAGTASGALNPLTGRPIADGLNPAFIGGVGQSLDALWAARYPTARLDLRVGLPLANRAAEANVAIAQTTGAQLRRQREQLAQAVEADVRNALQAVRSAEARVAAAGVARASAQQQYESELRRFEAGLATVFLVLQRQTDLVTAQAREIQAQADLSTATASLRRATGTTLEARGVQVVP